MSILDFLLNCQEKINLSKQVFYNRWKQETVNTYNKEINLNIFYTKVFPEKKN